MIKIEGMNHIGIASKNIERTKWFLQDVLKLKLVGKETIPSEQVDAVCYAPSASTSDEMLLELLTPTSNDSPVAKFLAKKGAGVHHLSFNVKDIRQAIATLKEVGVQVINDEPRKGINNTQVVFIHPKSTGGLLVELVQKG